VRCGIDGTNSYRWDLFVIDFLVKALPLISAILYTIVGIGYGIKKEWAWCLVWISYALANVGLVLAAMSGEK
jgi:hypothetical protein